MRPLQVFLPRLGYSLGHGPVARDAKRAFEHGTEGGLVYLLPRLGAPERWTALSGDRRLKMQAIPSEHQDALTVFHIGSNGVVWDSTGSIGRLLPSIDQLLETWINVDLKRASILAAPEFSLEYPAVLDGRIVRDGNRIIFDTVTERLLPGPAFPLSIDGLSSVREFGLAWPPPGTSIQSVDPDAESADTYGPRTGEERDGIPGAVDEDGNWHPHLIITWPGIFALLLGPAAGLGPFQLLADMRAILKEAHTDRSAALRRARAKATGHVSEGTARFKDAVFMPTGLQTRQAGQLRAFWETYGIKAESLDDALSAPRLQEPVTVTLDLPRPGEHLS